MLWAYIGYLVGYDLINIFKVYILSQKKVIKTRDIKFNKQLLFLPKYRELAPE